MNQHLVCANRPPDMTLPTHGRPAFLSLVAALAIGVKGLHQGRLPAGCLFFMAIRAALVFRGFIFHQAAVFIIDMMADVAFFDFGEFIVRVMPEHRRRAAWIVESVVVHKCHVFLGVSIDHHRQEKKRYCQGKENLLFHSAATLQRLSKKMVRLGDFFKLSWLYTRSRIELQPNP